MESQYLSKEYQKQFWATNKNARGFDHPVVEFARQWIDYVGRYIDLTQVRSAFDVGCGDGFATHYFAELIPRVEGGDISELMLEHNPIDRGSLKVIDAEDLDLPDGAYELVCMWEVLHHLKDPARAVREMSRVSSRYVVIFEPNRANVLQFLFGLANRQERGTLRSSKAYLERLTRQAGLEIIACDYCGKIPPNKTPRPDQSVRQTGSTPESTAGTDEKRLNTREVSKRETLRPTVFMSTLASTMGASDPDAVRQGLRFALAGGAVALIYPTTTTVLADVLGVPFQVALVIGFCAGLALHFTLQRSYENRAEVLSKPSTVLTPSWNTGNNYGDSSLPIIAPAASISFNPATVSNDRSAGSGRFPSGLQPFATNIAGGGDPAAGTGRCRRVAPTPATAAFGDSFDSRLGDQV